MGARNLAVSEMTLENKGKTRDAYLDSVYREFSPEHHVNEGSKQDNAQTSDKFFYNKKK